MEGGSHEIDDYEALPDYVSPSTHMIAGATAGITEHCIMYPIDSVKTRMQAINPAAEARYTGIMNACKTIAVKEGFGRAFHGMPIVVCGAGPSHAMYFACYEKLKEKLCDNKQGTLFATVVAGGCATLFHDAIMVPSDVIKQRMQMYNSPYSNSFQCAASIIRREGLRALYRSYTTQLAMNVPFQMVHFSVYEKMQNLLNYDRQYNPSSHMASGAVAGAIAALVTNPFDVCKTLLNTQEVCCTTGLPAQRGFWDAFRTVKHCRGGYRMFFRGAQARMVFQMPSAAISWSVYEFFKYGITKNNAETNYEPDSSSSGGSSSSVTSETVKTNLKLLPPPVYANDRIHTALPSNK